MINSLMMETRLYQLCFWLKDPGADKLPEAEEKKIEELISRLGGTIVSVFPLEKRSLAYPIKKQRVGFWGEIVFSLPSTKLRELEKQLSYEEALLRKGIFLMPTEKQKQTSKSKRPAMVTETPVETKQTEGVISDNVLETKLKEILGEELTDSAI